MESVVLIVTLEFWHLSGGWNGPCYRCSACRRSKPRLPPWSGQGWDSTLQDWRKETKIRGEMIEKSHLALWPDRTLTRFAAATSQIWEYARVWVFWSLQSASWNNSKVSKSRPAPGRIPCECRLRQSCLAQPKRPTWLCHCRWSGRRGGSPEQQVLYKIKFSGCSLLMQMWHLAGAGWPEVDTGSKSNAQHILTTPVHLWFEFYIFERMLNALCAIHSCMKQIPDWDRSRPAALGHRELWKGFWRSCAKPSSDSWVTLLQQITRGRCTMITWAAFDFWKTQGWGCRGTVAHWQCCAF